MVAQTRVKLHSEKYLSAGKTVPRHVSFSPGWTTARAAAQDAHGTGPGRAGAFYEALQGCFRARTLNPARPNHVHLAYKRRRCLKQEWWSGSTEQSSGERERKVADEPFGIALIRRRTFCFHFVRRKFLTFQKDFRRAVRCLKKFVDPSKTLVGRSKTFVDDLF